MEDIFKLDVWMRCDKWREASASTVFPSKSSWEWFKRKHRRALVEAGVLVLGSGRNCDTVDTAGIGKIVTSIRLQESLQRIGKTEAAV